MIQTKKCTICLQVKPWTDYSLQAKNRHPRAACKKCSAEKATKYREKNTEKIRKSQREYRRRNPKRAQANHFKRTYGITWEDKAEFLRLQDYTCPICGDTSDPNFNNKKWCMDHDHNTNQLRSVLCNRCNTGLGKFKDSVAVLEVAIAYLRGWEWIHQQSSN